MHNIKSKGKENPIRTELKKMTATCMKMGNRMRKKNDELTKTQKLLQTEIKTRKKIETEILDVTQAEQRRFGSQLHDGLCQELTAILIFSKSLAKKMAQNNILELAELNKISEMLLTAVDQARDTARGLYPGDLEGSSLMHSLEELTRHTSRANCKFICPKPILINNNNIATHLYRIVQEGISNAIEHGKSKNIEIMFTKINSISNLTIKDDGQGMSHTAINPGGIGLKIMKYRAHMIGAEFRILKNKPQGVILEFLFKLPTVKKKSL